LLVGSSVGEDRSRLRNGREALSAKPRKKKTSQRGARLNNSPTTTWP